MIVLYKCDEEILYLHNAIREKSHETRRFVILTLITNKRVTIINDATITMLSQVRIKSFKMMSVHKMKDKSMPWV